MKHRISQPYSQTQHPNLTAKPYSQTLQPNPASQPYSQTQHPNLTAKPSKVYKIDTF